MTRPDDREPRYVLLVDGDAQQAIATTQFLSVRGMEVTHASNAHEARDLVLRTSFDLVVIDASEDRRAGMHLLTHLSARPELPVLVVSDLVAVPDRLEALDHGADDYLSKPVDPHELLARMRAVHRRARRTQGLAWHQKRVCFVGWTLDLGSRHAVHESGQETELTEGEFHLLRVLLEHAGEALTRERLAALTHRDAGQVFHRSIDVLIGRLRRKLEAVQGAAPVIQTVRGEGYRVGVAPDWQ